MLKSLLTVSDVMDVYFRPAKFFIVQNSFVFIYLILFIVIEKVSYLKHDSFHQFIRAIFFFLYLKDRSIKIVIEMIKTNVLLLWSLIYSINHNLLHCRQRMFSLFVPGQFRPIQKLSLILFGNNLAIHHISFYHLHEVF